ncbi:ABC transporter permease [Corynebacterium uterequi]|uniref:ABC-2 family transporter protein n=1 Tax=Corynebacterium uterequi TaxID=1072256 RepID=A0A0G3HJ57_9CORY|nr:ABC transporter permease [Corynebacterium uterequi]AKK11137.1 ABC-2 family transporter protein [Corynebacterium uterequi]
MTTSAFALIWRYHLIRLLRSGGTWAIVAVVIVLAGTPGVLALYTPQIISALGGAEVQALVESTLPDPSWRQAAASWVKNLTQVLTMVLIATNAFSCHALRSHGDIPFMFPGSVRRSHYLLSSAATSAFFALALALGAAMVAWVGTVVVFPSAPLAPFVLASLVWVVQIGVIHAIQFLASAGLRGLGAPLAAGFSIYLVILVSAIWTQRGHASPLGLTYVITSFSQGVTDITWQWPVASSVGMIIVAVGAATYRYCRVELA